MQTVEKPDTVVFVSKYSSLRYPLFEGDKKVTKQWKDGRLELSELREGEIVEEMRRLIDEQYKHDADGKKIKNEKGNYILVKTELPFAEYDAFSAQVSGEILIPTEEKGKFNKYTAEEILKMQEKIKDLEELVEGEPKFENLKSETD